MEETRPRCVRLSNLAARYYVRDGWQLETVKKYLVRGELLVQNFLNMDDEYYILAVGGKIDVDRLLSDLPDLRVQPYGDEEKHKSARELLESRNW